LWSEEHRAWTTQEVIGAKAHLTRRLLLGHAPAAAAAAQVLARLDRGAVFTEAFDEMHGVRHALMLVARQMATSAILESMSYPGVRPKPDYVVVAAAAIGEQRHLVRPLPVHHGFAQLTFAIHHDRSALVAARARRYLPRTGKDAFTSASGVERGGNPRYRRIPSHRDRAEFCSEEARDHDRSLRAQPGQVQHRAISERARRVTHQHTAIEDCPSEWGAESILIRSAGPTTTDSPRCSAEVVSPVPGSEVAYSPRIPGQLPES